MVLLSGLNRTDTESAIYSCKRCGNVVYSEWAERFKIWIGRHIHSTNAYSRQGSVQPCTTLEEVASWVLQSLPLQAWRYLRVLYGNNKDVCFSSEDKRLFISAWRTALFHFYPLMHYFIKLLADGTDQRMQLLLKHPLWLAILIAGAQRVRRYVIPSYEWLQQGEFKMSRNEYAFFGLNPSQSWQITRALENLIRHGFITKSDNKAGRKQINVYRFTTYDIIAPYLQEQTANEQQADTKQAGARQQADTSQTANRHSKKNKKESKEIELEKDYLPSLIVKEGVLGGDGDNFKKIMNVVEKEGVKFLKLWNAITGRSDLMDEKIKKGLYNIIESVSLSQFEKRVELFQSARMLIETEKLQKYLYYKIELYDCGMFLGQFNTFYWDLLSVFEKIILDQDRKPTMSKIKSLINKQSDPLPEVIEVKAVTATNATPNKDQVEYLKNLKKTMLTKFSVQQ